MSIKIMSQVWEHSSHKSTELLTLLALADWANDDGFCWYGMGRIAKRVRIEHRGLARVFGKLVVSGELMRLRRYHDEKRVNETTVSVVLTGCDSAEKQRRLDSAHEHLKGIVKADYAPSVLDALTGSGLEDTTSGLQDITPSGLEATQNVIQPSIVTVNSKLQEGADAPRVDTSTGELLPSKADKPAAVTVYREVMHCYPAKAWHDRITDAVGEDGLSLQRWRDVLMQWIGRGYSPKNVEGVLDVFRAGWKQATSPKAQKPAKPDYLGGKYADEIQH